MSSETSMSAEEREEFRGIARDFLAKASDHDRVRTVVATGGSPDPKLREQAAQMGWFGLEIPDEFGGAGAQFADLVVLLEESGEALSSLSLLSTSVLCAGAILHAGTAEQQCRLLPGLAEGTESGTAALPGIFRGSRASESGVIASTGAGGYTLDGACHEVVDARSSDLIVVAARQTSTDGTSGETVVGVIRRDADGVSIEARPMVDATRPLDSVRLDGVVLEASDVLATGAIADHLVTTLVNRAAVAIAADSLGVGRRVLAMTVTYASQRFQFGRAIGSFQAVKHQAADVLVDNEVGTGLVTAAADALDRDPSTAVASRQSSMAKSFACAAGSRSAGVAVQLHGGIGYTWEHDMHLYLKRAALNEQMFGTDAWHTDRIAQHLL